MSLIDDEELKHTWEDREESTSQIYGLTTTPNCQVSISVFKAL